MMPLPVADLVDEFNVGPITVHRPGLGAVNAYGGITPAADAMVQITPVAVHPVSGRDLLQVPEAQRNSEVVRLYTRERLYVGDGGQMPDGPEYRGRRFKVTNAEDFELQGGVYMALAALEESP